MSIKRIAATLGVSPSSVFHWTRDIELTAEQKWRNVYRGGGPHDPAGVARRAETWRQRSREKRLAYQREGRLAARRREPLHLAGCMLYWAEGSKSRNTLKLCNSDVNMLRFFRGFVSTCFDVTREEFRVRLHVYLGNGLSIAEIESYWLDALGLPRSCIRGHSINPLPTSSSGRKRNKLPYGVCTLSLGNTRVVQHIYGAIQKYGGFEEPRWLDGPDYETRRSRKRGASDETAAAAPSTVPPTDPSRRR